MGLFLCSKHLFKKKLIFPLESKHLYRNIAIYNLKNGSL